MGEPKPSALVLVQAVSAVPELLAFADNIERVRTLLPGFSAELAFVFSAPELFPPPPPDQCREMSLSEIAAQDHLSDDRLAQLSDVAEGGVPVAAAFDGMRPVAFAYVASESESLMNQRKWCPKAK
ncbi:hypothetical protein [Candidatus Chloroploca sp. Khr17]|uniref:hypothetical protein n=1 Tax=Candidatus Chloroploca sp. Khr17 TaxID=2496869 RepID=UPI0013EC4EA1|nr:hypothetical protein [Candidatus Chloroploca sp. Khr17]